MNSLFQVPAEIVKVSSMAHKSIRLQIDTQENMTDESMSKLMGMLDKVGWLTFSTEEIQPDDLLKLPALTWDKDEKSPGQRLRSVLFVLWEQKKPTETFAQFYDQQMERFVSAVKEKLV